MASVATKLTVDEFLALPEKPGVKRELINGEIWEEDIPYMGSAGEGHEQVKSQLGTHLGAYSLQVKNIRVMFETAYRFEDEQCAIPDLSILSGESLDRKKGSLIRRVPLICVEVVSSDSVPRLREKIKLYFTHGVAEVWVLYPATEEISIHRPAHYVRELGAEDTLSTDLLPGFSTPVSILFQ